MLLDGYPLLSVFLTLQPPHLTPLPIHPAMAAADCIMGASLSQLPVDHFLLGWGVVTAELTQAVYTPGGTKQPR